MTTSARSTTRPARYQARMVWVTCQVTIHYVHVERQIDRETARQIETPSLSTLTHASREGDREERETDRSRGCRIRRAEAF